MGGGACSNWQYKMFIDLNEGLERLHSRRLVLRPLCLADAWPLHAATKVPAFNAHLAWDAPANFEAVVMRVQAIMTASRQGRLAAVSAVNKSTGAWVSLFRFLPWKVDPTTIEVGIWTHVDYWRGEYSLELGHMCIDAAFTLTNASRVVGLSLPENRSSCRLMEKVRMLPVSTDVRIAENGRRLDVVQYELRREAWEAARVSRELRFERLDTDGPIATDLENGYRIVDARPVEAAGLPEARLEIQLPLADKPTAHTVLHH